MALGPENFSIDFAEFYIDDTRIYSGDTVEVDPETSHKLWAKYRVSNQGASTFHWWEVCVTVYDVTHGKAVGSKNAHAQGWLSTTKNQDVSIGRIDEPTEFRIKIWANQDYNASPPAQGYW